MDTQVIYLDNNATTRIDSRVLEAMMPFLTNEYANANSTHRFGLVSNDAVKTARAQVAALIQADVNEVIFTSGATEAINIAIKGVAESYCWKGRHIITAQTEHRAVLDTCQYLQKQGYEITYLSVNPDGLVDLDELKSCLRQDTILVTIMFANNETGVIQPIKEIAELAHSVDAIFMSDCTQVAGKIEICVDKLGIDLLCFSAHKIYGPKGIGVLYIRQRGKRIRIPGQLHGGGHERGLRSGTLNVPAIVGLGKACEIATQEMKKNEEYIVCLRDYLETELLRMTGTSVNGNVASRLYNVSNIRFEGVDSDAIIIGLGSSDSGLPIIAVSNGSACTSNSIEPSHVLISMGLNEVDAFSSIRFSLGVFNTLEEMDMTIVSLNTVIASLKQMS